MTTSPPPRDESAMAKAFAMVERARKQEPPTSQKQAEYLLRDSYANGILGIYRLLKNHRQSLTGQNLLVFEALWTTVSSAIREYQPNNFSVPELQTLMHLLHLTNEVSRAHLEQTIRLQDQLRGTSHKPQT